MGVPLWRVPGIGKYALGLRARESHRLPLFEGVDRLLRVLSDTGIKLAIVTSNSTENVQRILGAENAALIQYYECGVQLFGKQSKLKKVIKRSGVLPHEAICIGD